MVSQRTNRSETIYIDVDPPAPPHREPPPMVVNRGGRLGPRPVDMNDKFDDISI
ncbi:hypothetical protein FRC12_012209, partial [Ceratobasidium sp. 428]